MKRPRPTYTALMSPDLPSVSVVIPVRNEAGSIGATLRAVLEMPYDGQLDVVVADGMSTDATRSIVQSFGDQVMLVENVAQTTPSGLNRAIEASTGEIILRCDAHSILPRDYASTAVRLIGDTGAANVGGIQRAVGSTAIQSSIAFAMTSRAGTGDAHFHRGGKAGPTDTVYLGVFRRAALEEIGLFDESLIRNQDYELNHRLRQAGEIVYFSPELAVEYQPRSSFARLARQYFQYGQWKRHVLSIHQGSLRLRQLAPPTLILGLLAAAIAIVAGQGWAWALPVAYLVSLIGVGVLWAIQERLAAAIILMPMALATMHLSWGAGFFRNKPSTIN